MVSMFLSVPFPICCSSKAHQMGRCLQEYQDSKLSELASSLGTDDLQVMSHLKQSIAMAMKVYHTWQNKRLRT